MMIAPIPIDEKERLAALKKYNILDTGPDAALDAIVQLASYICQTPIAAISLIDENRLWFNAITGLDETQTPRNVAFCAHTILHSEPMIVADARLDERFFDNPLVASASGIRFYAGVPLETSEGLHLGALCVLDRVPRELNQEQIKIMQVLANHIMAHLDLRLSHQQARQYINDLQLAEFIFDAASEAMMVSDAEDRIITVNPAFSLTTGYTRDEVVGRNPSFLNSGRQSNEVYQKILKKLNTTGHWNGELWNKRKSGEEFAEHLSINVIYNEDGTKRLHVAIFSDITEKMQSDELIWNQANYDHLTQLPNRRLLQDRLKQKIKLAHRLDQSVAVLFIDLDHFKEVNDTLGHNVGDQLLVQVANRVSQCVREADTVARLGGDEFIVVLSQINDAIHIDKVAKNVIEKLSQSFVIDGVELNVSASVGIAVSPKDGDNVEDLIKNADIAMYAAKNAGRGRFCYYEVAE